MLVEVQPETEEAQTLVWTGHQQHKELLDDALNRWKQKEVISCWITQTWSRIYDGENRTEPGRNGWGFEAGIASSVWCPETPESASSLPLPVLPSHPIRPEPADRHQSCWDTSLCMGNSVDNFLKTSSALEVLTFNMLFTLRNRFCLLEHIGIPKEAFEL